MYLRMLLILNHFMYSVDCSSPPKKVFLKYYIKMAQKKGIFINSNAYKISKMKGWDTFLYSNVPFYTQMYFQNKKTIWFLWHHSLKFLHQTILEPRFPLFVECVVQRETCTDWVNVQSETMNRSSFISASELTGLAGPTLSSIQLLISPSYFLKSRPIITSLNAGTGWLTDKEISIRYAGIGLVRYQGCTGSKV